MQSPCTSGLSSTVPETLGVASDSLSVDRVMRSPATRVRVEQSPPSAGFSPATQCPMPGKLLLVNRLTGWFAAARPSFDRLRCWAWLWSCACGREPPGRVWATEPLPQPLHDSTKVAKELTAYPCSDHGKEPPRPADGCMSHATRGLPQGVVHLPAPSKVLFRFQRILGRSDSRPGRWSGSRPRGRGGRDK